MNLREQVKAAIAYGNANAKSEGGYSEQVWVYVKANIEPDMQWPVYLLATDEYAETGYWLEGRAP